MFKHNGWAFGVILFSKILGVFPLGCGETDSDDLSLVYTIFSYARISSFLLYYLIVPSRSRQSPSDPLILRLGCITGVLEFYIPPTI